MKWEQDIEHILGLINHFKGRKETEKLRAAEADAFLKVFSDPWSIGDGYEQKQD